MPGHPRRIVNASLPLSKATVRVMGDATGYGLRFLGKHGWRMMLWFVCLLLPLWGFASLVGEVHKKAVFPFDAPMLNFLHSLARRFVRAFVGGLQDNHRVAL